MTRNCEETVTNVWTGAFMVCMMEKHNPHPYCFTVKIHFNLVET